MTDSGGRRLAAALLRDTAVRQQRGVTLASWIRRRRLERIRRDLADPALADRSVAMIAAGWGLLDATHLSRALRAEFGQSAAEIRGSSPVTRRGEAAGTDAIGECLRRG